MRKASWFALCFILATGLMVGCQNNPDPLQPGLQGEVAVIGGEKDGNEILGLPSIAIANGTGIAAAGVGLHNSQPGDIVIDVPAGATVNQVLLYWEGQNATEGGDDTITAGGNSVTGTLIGGSTEFFDGAWSSTYRADISSLNLVNPGTNTITISGMDFTRRNNGAGIMVIYSEPIQCPDPVLGLFDGNDLAYFEFASPLDTTEPVTFNFGAAGAGITREAELHLFFGSIAPNRGITVTVKDNMGNDLPGTPFVDFLGNTDGPEWDTAGPDDGLIFQIPGDISAITVQALSATPSDLVPASFAWVAAGFSIPCVPLACIGDYVWEDVDQDGCQDTDEPGISGVTVNLWTCDTSGDPLAMIDTATTDGLGFYEFCELIPGDYVVEFVAPSGYEFTTPNVDCGDEDCSDSDADPTTGIATCTNLEPGEYDDCWDAGLFVPEACIGDFVWEDVNMDGCQDTDEPGIEDVTVYLLDCIGSDPQGIIDQTTTDANGFYEFCELAPGDYAIQFVAPAGYEFTTPNVDCGDDDCSDSDADPATGLTACTNLVADEYDDCWDAGLYVPQEGCTHTIGYWKNHAGFGPQEDVVTALLPQYLGNMGGTKTLAVMDALTAVRVLSQKYYGRPNNGITKLYAQLLGAKLSVQDGASNAAVAAIITAADNFLADHDHNDWSSLTDAEIDNVMDWHDTLDLYNNGDIGPGHCDEFEEDEE